MSPPPVSTANIIGTPLQKYQNNPLTLALNLPEPLDIIFLSWGNVSKIIYRTAK